MYIVTTGWLFYISFLLCENSSNQSIKRLTNVRLYFPNCCFVCLLRYNMPMWRMLRRFTRVQTFVTALLHQHAVVEMSKTKNASLQGFLGTISWNFAKSKFWERSSEPIDFLVQIGDSNIIQVVQSLCWWCRGRLAIIRAAEEDDGGNRGRVRGVWPHRIGGQD